MIHQLIVTDTARHQLLYNNNIMQTILYKNRNIPMAHIQLSTRLMWTPAWWYKSRCDVPLQWNTIFASEGAHLLQQPNYGQCYKVYHSKDVIALRTGHSGCQQQQAKTQYRTNFIWFINCLDNMLF